MKTKKGIALETLAIWIIALVVLVLVVFGIILLKGKGTSALNYIKELFRFKG